MAAVESISAVIKDSDKEHVLATPSEIVDEDIKLFNGEAEMKGPGVESSLEGKCAVNTCKDDCQSVAMDTNEEIQSLKTVSCEESQVDCSKKSDEKCKADIKERSEESKGLENNDCHEDVLKHESCAEETVIDKEMKVVKKECSGEVSNGSVDENSIVNGKSVANASFDVKEEKMDIDDNVEKSDRKIKLENRKDDEEGANGKEREKTNQNFLLDKLGFSAVKQLAIENMPQVKNENVDVSNYETSQPNKLVLKAQENILGEILDNKMTVSSKSSSSEIVMNGNDKEEYKGRRMCEQKTLIDSLKEDLRNEEAKLLLLRKVFDSQTNRKNGSLPLHKMKENSSRHMSMPSLHPKNRVPGHSFSGSPSESNSIQIAPKVVIGSKGAQPGSNLPRIVPSIVSSGTTTSPANGESPRVTYAQIHGNAPTTGVISQPVHKYYIQVGNQLVPAAPPTCINQPVYAMPAYSNATSSTAKATSSVTTTATVPSVKPKSQPSLESQASKHSAAKAALRRQLEQTLLQIPPPRPPSADWHVIPNVNSMDFMMLVGLDEIVDMILENDGKPTLKNILTETLPENPLICDQCGMDFSAQWKQKESEKSSDVLCEKCSLTNTKKDLKAEHTSRLKSAFLKALKQEQEIEEKIKAGEDVNIGSPPLEKESQSGVISHHQSMHSMHKPYKQHQKSQKSSDHHHPIVHHHHHQVVQHYPHHTSLVHQLHQQHMQQQQVDYDPPGSSSHRSARWHPYMPSHHHGSSHVHNVPHHRTYSGSSSRGSDARHEYYVVHHPQHSSSARWAH